jgi:hypothetical protein
MIVSFKPEVAEHVDLEFLFDILDNHHDARIDGLELLGGLALCCHSSFEEKCRFCFELFDFNLNSLLSKKKKTCYYEDAIIMWYEFTYWW